MPTEDAISARETMFQTLTEPHVPLLKVLGLILVGGQQHITWNKMVLLKVATNLKSQRMEHAIAHLVMAELVMVLVVRLED